MKYKIQKQLYNLRYIGIPTSVHINTVANGECMANIRENHAKRTCTRERYYRVKICAGEHLVAVAFA